MPDSVRASRTPSILKGLIIASIFFIRVHFVPSRFYGGEVQFLLIMAKDRSKLAKVGFPPPVVHSAIPECGLGRANNTHGLGPGHNRGKARTNPDAIPLLVKNFKRDALNQPF
jgi:hypothetical protein